MRLPVAVWIATRAALLLCVLKVFTLPGPDVTTDVSMIYHGWYEVLSTGNFPQDDVTWQYPPGAALAVLSPGLLPFLDYASAFFALVCAADAVTFGLLLRAGRRPGNRLAGAWCWVVGVPLLGPTAYARYDLMVTAVAVVSLLALARRPRVAGALAAFGAMLKVWPALLLLSTPRGRATRRAWLTACGTALALLLGFALTMPGALDFLTAQRDRGVEIESVGALVFHIARQFGWEGQVLFHYGSLEFLGPQVSLVGNVSLALSVLSFGWLLVWRLRSVEWTASTPADAAFAGVLLFTVTSRVISPQYLVWLVGLAAVAVTARASRQRLPALLVLLATLVTVLEFPVWFAHVVASDSLGVTLMVLRNGLLVAAALLSATRLWQDTVSGPRPRRAHRAGHGTRTAWGAEPAAAAGTAPDEPSESAGALAETGR
ncbi:glycosyltransferase family 87 protein [Streptomyces oceani]|uniref:glycosyltransferase family 87 protein n=1 Tax=Streptomyces oceani TaxID=1075402 RepID=UPI000AB4D05B|nr:glycosyltransferase family 87 protein [Streptomyces oceani]